MMIARQLARAGPHRVDAVERDQRGRVVDGVHDVVERTRQRVDVLAVDRRDEGLVQPLDDLVRQEVALVLDFLDLVRLVGDRRIDGEHLFEQARARAELVGHHHEVVVELSSRGSRLKQPPDPP